MTRQELETALDSGRLEINGCYNGSGWYRARRNGKTRTWKRDAERFEVPIKWAFKNYGTIDRHNLDSKAIRIAD
jgi:hypothetical protein